MPQRPLLSLAVHCYDQAAARRANPPGHPPGQASTWAAAPCSANAHHHRTTLLPPYRRYGALALCTAGRTPPHAQPAVARGHAPSNPSPIQQNGSRRAAWLFTVVQSSEPEWMPAFFLVLGFPCSLPSFAAVGLVPGAQPRTVAVAQGAVQTRLQRPASCHPHPPSCSLSPFPPASRRCFF